ncbi:hypothetical protein [Kibdelosporangium philippinense]|uniref:hypothetical protein n=1 Tax=Kibdelosporangium philippinense TaxID=211113 RepID=UPI0036141EBF
MSGLVQAKAGWRRLAGEGARGSGPVCWPTQGPLRAKSTSDGWPVCWHDTGPSSSGGWPVNPQIRGWPVRFHVANPHSAGEPGESSRPSEVPTRVPIKIRAPSVARRGERPDDSQQLPSGRHLRTSTWREKTSHAAWPRSS